MAISGLQVINVGLPNESIDSDSLYTAFNKTKNNFNTLFQNASPYNTYTGNVGIAVSSNATSGVVDITNTGVLSLTAGNGIVLSGSNGNVTIVSTGGGNGGSGTLTSVSVVGAGSNARITSSGGPIIGNGTITLDLAATGVTSGSYTYPTITVDSYGRITNIANASSVGTVTSVELTPGFGIQVTGGPITTSGAMTVINTGVTRLSAGTGISLSGSNGNITVSTVLGSGTVTSVGVTSSSLTVSGSPIVAAGTITVELPTTVNMTNANISNTTTMINATIANTTVTGKFLASGSEDLANGAAANLAFVATYFSTSAAETGTLAIGTAGQIKTFMMVADSGDMVITVTNAGWKTSGTGTMTFGDIGDGCTLQYIANKWFCIGNNGVVFA
jgi:hypothetical protein